MALSLKNFGDELKKRLAQAQSAVSWQSRTLPGYSGNQSGLQVGDRFYRVGQTVSINRNQPTLSRIADASRMATESLPQSVTRTIQAAPVPQRIKQAVAQPLGELVGGIGQNTTRGVANIAGGIQRRNLTQVAGGAFQVAKPFLAATASPGQVLANMGIGAGLGALQGNAGKGAAEGFGFSAITRFTNPATNWAMKTVVDPKAGLLARQIGKRGIAGAANVIEDKIIDKSDGRQRGVVDDALSFGIGAALGGNDDILDLIRRSPKQAEKTLVERGVQRKKAQQFIERVRKNGTKFRQSVGKGGFGKATDVTDPRVGFIKDPSRPSTNIIVRQSDIVSGRVDPKKVIRKATDGYELRDFTDGPVAPPSKLPAKDPMDIRRIRLGQTQSAFGAVAGIEPERDENGNLTGRFTYNPMAGAAGVAVMGGIKTKAGREALEKVGTKVRGLKQKSIPSDMLRAGKNQDIEGLATPGLSGKAQLAKGLNQPRDPGIVSGSLEKSSLNPRTQGKIGLQQLTSQAPVVSKGSSEAIVTQQEVPYFNTNRINLSKKKQSEVAQAVSVAKPAIEKKIGKKLTNKEVVEAANRSARVINTAVGREQTAAWEASLLKARQLLAQQAQDGELTSEYLNNLVNIKSHATDIARKLQSFSIGADPKLVTSKEAILEAVLKVEQDTSKVLEAARGINFNDQKQAQEFYRQFIKPNASEWIDTLRYNSMLSSPNTHINNFFANWQGTGLITPIEKTITGSIDALKSALTGKPRSYFIGEGATFAKGYYSSIGKATKAFTDVLANKTLSGNLDTRQIPLASKGLSGVAYKTLALPMQLLEAGDQFFTALTKGGLDASMGYRLRKGAKIGDAARIIDEEAARRLFRSELGENNGAVVLDALDVIANKVQSLKASKNPVISTLAKFSLPFLRTPTNILKQGVEYSPLGLTTLWGSKTQTEQVSKAIMGSSILMGTAIMLSSDRLSWSEPTSEKQKNAFRAAGMQPYSVKIGDKWVSYSKLHPAISFNLALVAAVKHSLDSGTLDESKGDAILQGLGDWMTFFADQSYMKNIGDLVAGAKGDVDRKISLGGNYAQQLIPFRALMSWVNRIIDPYQRQVDKNGSALQKQFQYIASQIPGLSGNVPVRLDPLGNPIENQNRTINALSPVRITTEKPIEKQKFDVIQQKVKLDKEIDAARNSLKLSGDGAKILGKTILYYDDDGEVQKVDLSKFDKEPPGAIEKIRWEQDKFAAAMKIYRANGLTQEQKGKIFSDLKLNGDDLAYYDIASDDTRGVRRAFTDQVIASSKDRKELINNLASLRREVGSSRILSDSVIDDLYSDEIITEAEKAYLKSLKWDAKTGKVVEKKKKPKTYKVTTAKTNTAIKWNRITGREGNRINIGPSPVARQKTFQVRKISV